jgi:hypothetical protein
MPAGRLFGPPDVWSARVTPAYYWEPARPQRRVGCLCRSTCVAITALVAEEAVANSNGHGNQLWWRAPGVWLKAAASTTTAIGIVTYAVLRVDYALFYDRFGLKPEDVGLGQAELISQSLAGVVLILAVTFVELVILATLVWIWGVLLLAIRTLFGDVARRDGIVAAILLGSLPLWWALGQVIGATTAAPWVLVAVGPVALLCLAWVAWAVSAAAPRSQFTPARAFGGLAVVIFVVSLAAQLVYFWWIVVGFVGLFVMAAAIIEQVSRRRSPRADNDERGRNPESISADVDPARTATPMTEASDVDKVAAATPMTEAPDVDKVASSASLRWRRPRLATIRVVLVAALVGTVAITETLLAFSAVSDANYVRSGHAVQPTFLGVPLVSWGARAVEVAWVGLPPAGQATLVDHCFLYLGQGGGVVLLYDHDAGRTVRISSSAVVLSIQPQANYEPVCPR